MLIKFQIKFYRCVWVGSMSMMYRTESRPVSTPVCVGGKYEHDDKPRISARINTGVCGLEV